MKKLFLISSVVAGLLLSVASAKPLDYELTPLIGSNIPEDNYDLRGDGNTLDTHLVSGLEIQFNQAPVIHPEISFTYALGEYDNGLETDIMRIALNGVYQYDTQYVTPFLKAGFGFNMMSEPKDYYTTAIDFGAGLKFNFTDNIALKTEFIHISDFNDGEWNSNMTFVAGLTISFGTAEESEVLRYEPADIAADGIITNLDDEVIESNDEVKKESLDIKDDGNDMYQDDIIVEEIVEENKEQKNNTNSFKETELEIKNIPPKVVNIVNNDRDNDGISDYADKCIYTPPGVRVYANGCRIDEDDDKDGILNSIDECPNTPLNSKVNTKGCVKKVDKKYKNIIQLNIEFKYKSFEVTDISKEEVLMLADFLNNNTTYNIRVIGYTDNKGSRAYNKKLSQKRANAIKNMLIKNKVSANRISSVGMGEANPIADNDSENGRAKNRRIEVELIKK